MRPSKEEFRRAGDLLRRITDWFAARRAWPRRRQRELRLCENLALGERRFLSVVECGQQRFLLGGSPNSLVVLAELTSPSTVVQPAEEENVPTYKVVGGELAKDMRCG